MAERVVTADPSPPSPAGRWARLQGALVRLEEALAGLLVASVVGLVLAQVVCRRLFDRPLVWSEELCTQLFIAATLAGAAAATGRRRHVRLTLLVERLPDATRWERRLDVLLAILLAGLVPGTVALAAAVHRLGLRSPALGWPMAWLYALVPLALALFALQLLLPPLQASRGAAGGPEESQP